MPALSHKISVAALAGFALLTLAGCVSGSSQPAVSPTDTQDIASVSPSQLSNGPVRESLKPPATRQEQYAEAVDTFAYPLPSGFAFPEKVPAEGWGEDGGRAARYLWGCFVINAAWDAAISGDRVTADSLIALLDQDTATWDIPGLRSSEWSENMRYAGDSGICAQWAALSN